MLASNPTAPPPPLTGKITPSNWRGSHKARPVLALLCVSRANRNVNGITRLRRQHFGNNLITLARRERSFGGRQRTSAQLASRLDGWMNERVKRTLERLASDLPGRG